MADDDRRPLVQNAADPKQVRHAKRQEKEAREIELEDLRIVLSTEAGRRFAWRVLTYCKVFADTFDESVHRTAFNSGVQNVGHFVMGEITAASEDGLFLMMSENRARQQKLAGDAEAMRTKRHDEEDS